MQKQELQQSLDFPDSFYRVSIKGLCVHDGKVLLSHESEEECGIKDGVWELPGGGMDFGEEPHAALRREVKEEMGLEIHSISERPVYVWTNRRENLRGMNWHYSIVIAYRVEFSHLDITPSAECERVQFFSKEEMSRETLNHQTKKFYEIFDPNDFK